jgi:hypothetical protein
MKDSIELPRRIVIDGDELVLDRDFCDEVLGGANLKTAKRYEGLGLPFAMVAGRKYRPLREGRAWVAGLIQRRGQTPKRVARGV